MEDIVELVGRETYVIEYGEKQRAVSWLETDSDGTFEFDVRDTISGLDYDREFVTQFATIDPTDTDEEGYPLRASLYADLLTEIWDSKGNVGQNDEPR